MNDYFHNATHEVFRAMIGFNYIIPVVTAWDYSLICNTAAPVGFDVLAILEDGVVYKSIPQQK